MDRNSRSGTRRRIRNGARRAVAGALTLLAAACGGSPGGTNAAGAALFASQACSTCHGQEGAGTPFGPTLQGKKRYWTRETLVRYLKDPMTATAKDARLSEQARKFALPMQRFDKLTPAELDAVADFVLSMP